MTPERRERLISAIHRAANVVPCSHHYAPMQVDAHLRSQTDAQLEDTIKTLEFIVDEAMGTDA